MIASFSNLNGINKIPIRLDTKLIMELCEEKYKREMRNFVGNKERTLNLLWKLMS